MIKTVMAENLEHMEEQSEENRNSPGCHRPEVSVESAELSPPPLCLVARRVFVLLCFLTLGSYPFVTYFFI